MNGQRILTVDDDEQACRALGDLLASWGYECEVAFDATDAIKKALDFRPELVLSDCRMPGNDGTWLLRSLKKNLPHCSLVFLTGQGNIESAVAALREGAYDYLEKPLEAERLKSCLQRLFHEGPQLREAEALRRKLKGIGQADFVGQAASIRKVLEWVQRVAPSRAAVAITGESGTGKEMVARAIHRLSPRLGKPFVAVNCASIPATLMESEIFGHERGAFTGAEVRRPGVFEQAHLGTLFLDEVGEIPIELQAKLLRVLEEGKLRRLGGKAEIDVDVRVLCATNRDLKEEIRSQRFREDLFFRLNVFQIRLPPLRERREDVAMLTQHFVEKFALESQKNIQGVSSDVLSTLKGYHWPGNIRELKNTLERAVILCDGAWLTQEHLPAELSGHVGEATALRIPFGLTLDDVEKEYILKSLAQNGNNKARTADLLGVSEKTLYNKLNRYQAEKSQRASPAEHAREPGGLAVQALPSVP